VADPTRTRANPSSRGCTLEDCAADSGAAVLVSTTRTGVSGPLLLCDESAQTVHVRISSNPKVRSFVRFCLPIETSQRQIEDALTARPILRLAQTIAVRRKRSTRLAPARHFLFPGSKLRAILLNAAGKPGDAQHAWMVGLESVSRRQGERIG